MATFETKIGTGSPYTSYALKVFSEADNFVVKTSIALLFAFFTIVLKFVFSHSAHLFLGRYGRTHRIVGAIYLCVLLIGVIDLSFHELNHLYYDIILGVLGTTVTLTAAHDFRNHKYVKNVASGILEKDSTVSHSEMVEHSFYQILNLVQSLYLHTQAFLVTCSIGKYKDSQVCFLMRKDPEETGFVVSQLGFSFAF
mmetsp:Transcript_11125/g.13902  ORF Transcript_11125/g.13902 Transcript_11125/m.13902 type:complete len:197 (-) Transcript_11125:2030-2620(-)